MVDEKSSFFSCKFCTNHIDYCIFIHKIDKLHIELKQPSLLPLPLSSSPNDNILLALSNVEYIPTSIRTISKIYYLPLLSSTAFIFPSPLDNLDNFQNGVTKLCMLCIKQQSIRISLGLHLSAPTPWASWLLNWIGFSLFRWVFFFLPLSSFTSRRRSRSVVFLVEWSFFDRTRTVLVFPAKSSNSGY